MKSLVLTGFGINCEKETQAAYKMLNIDCDIVHLNDIFNGKINIHNYSIINFPGGFSYGDELGSGKILSNKIKYQMINSQSTLFDELKKFIKQKKIIIGICNGFQILVKLGLLPNTLGNFEQEVTLYTNDSNKFINDWVNLKVENDSLFFKNLSSIYLPIRHKEGKIIIKNELIKNNILNNKLNILSYINNPNGSELDIAALTDISGQVLGIMPHPEAFLSIYNHPDWNKLKSENKITTENGEGLKIFENIINYLKF